MLRDRGAPWKISVLDPNYGTRKQVLQKKQLSTTQTVHRVGAASAIFQKLKLVFSAFHCSKFVNNILKAHKFCVTFFDGHNSNIIDVISRYE